MRTEIGKGTTDTLGCTCCAGVSAEKDDAVAKVGAFLGKEERGHDALDFERILFFFGIGTETTANADKVGVRDHSGLAENVTEQEVCDLASHTRKEKKLLHRVGNTTVKVSDEKACALAQIVCLGAVKSASAYRLREFFKIRLCHIGGGGVFLKERFRYLIDTLIRALRGEPSHDEKPPGVSLIFEGTSGIGVDLF